MAQKHDQVSSDRKHFQPLENQSVLNHLHHKIHHTKKVRNFIRGETSAQVGRVVLHLKIRHDKGIDERPDLVGQLLDHHHHHHHHNHRQYHHYYPKDSPQQGIGDDIPLDIFGELIVTMMHSGKSVETKNIG